MESPKLHGGCCPIRASGISFVCYFVGFRPSRGTTSSTQFIFKPVGMEWHWPNSDSFIIIFFRLIPAHLENSNSQKNISYLFTCLTLHQHLNNSFCSDGTFNEFAKTKKFKTRKVTPDKNKYAGNYKFFISICFNSRTSAELPEVRPAWAAGTA